jgi:hypothetical protein
VKVSDVAVHGTTEQSLVLACRYLREKHEHENLLQVSNKQKSNQKKKEEDITYCSK